MNSSRLCMFGATLLAVFAMVGTANAQLTLVPNGDFEAGGTDWVFAGVGTSESFPTTGGNTGGHGQIDQTAGGWGGVLVAEDAGLGLSLTSLQLVAGNTYTFSVDMIDLNPGATALTAGMKIENWDDGTSGNIGDSGDVVFAITDTWETYTFDFLVDSNAVGLKFVPLMVGQATGSSVGFDNVGVLSAVPEPGSLGLITLGLVGFVARRRRR